ncbi:peptidase S8/S53 domain-containing protein [Syncephalis fuscata]|nr:peptidase S8/S53 domain-containing protein [Syncephalis fuscata]
MLVMLFFVRVFVVVTALCSAHLAHAGQLYVLPGHITKNAALLLDESASASHVYMAQLNNSSNSNDAQIIRELFIEHMVEKGGKFLNISYEVLLNGVVFELKGSISALESLASLNNVKGIWPATITNGPIISNYNTEIDLGKTRYTSLQRRQESQSVLAPGPALMGIIPAFKSQTTDYGQKINVGIIDTGIDYKHIALGSCFGLGCKVADPMDTCNGHGTHVAGTIAGFTSEFSGIAPQATLGAYRVLGCANKVGAPIIISALERAAKDNMQVINLSIGISRFWPNSMEVSAIQKLFEKGIIVVASAGNMGTQGLFGITSIASVPEVISVGAVDSEAYMAYTFSLQSSKNARILALNAQAAGAAGIIIYDQFPGYSDPYVGATSINIPVLLVPLDSGNILRPTRDLNTIKPEVVALGGYIYSTFPRGRGSWATLTGTSMAAPQISEVAAVLYSRIVAKSSRLHSSNHDWWSVGTRLYSPCDVSVNIGSLRAIPIIQRNESYPRLELLVPDKNITSNDFAKLGYVFGKNVVVALRYRLTHASQHVHLAILDARTNSTIGTYPMAEAYEKDQYIDDSNDDTFILWNTSYSTDSKASQFVPPGQYRFRLFAHTAFPNASDKDSYEAWIFQSSQLIQI